MALVRQIGRIRQSTRANGVMECPSRHPDGLLRLSKESGQSNSQSRRRKSPGLTEAKPEEAESKSAHCEGLEPARAADSRRLQAATPSINATAIRSSRSTRRRRRLRAAARRFSRKRRNGDVEGAGAAGPFPGSDSTPPFGAPLPARILPRSGKRLMVLLHSQDTAAG